MPASATQIEAPCPPLAPGREMRTLLQFMGRNTRVVVRNMLRFLTTALSTPDPGRQCWA
jgi:hypothetical protein